MAQQNIYDDEIFFEGYKKIRDNIINANNLFEIPTLFSMLPDLKNKRILDLRINNPDYVEGGDMPKTIANSCDKCIYCAKK